MAWAPYTNDRRNLQSDPALLGQFRHKETEVWFEYGENITGYLEDYPHVIWVCDGYRYAKVLKTVAYIAVDEDAYGEPIVEKWAIKTHKEYVV